MLGSNNNSNCVVSLFLFLFLNFDSFVLSLIYNNGYGVSTQEYPWSIAGGQRLICCDGATDRAYYYFDFNCDDKFRLYFLFLLLLCIWGAKVIGLKRMPL